MGTNLNQSINSGIQGLCEAEYYEQSLEIELDPPCSRSNKRCQGPKCDLLSGDKKSITLLGYRRQQRRPGGEDIHSLHLPSVVQGRHPRLQVRGK